MTIAQRGEALSQRWKALFRDHEIYIRTGGEVRFLHLGAKLQRRLAAILVAVLSVWIAVTIYMAGAQLYDRWYRSDVATRAIAVERAEQRFVASRDRIAQQVQALTARQSFVEDIIKEMSVDGETPDLGAAANLKPAAALGAAPRGDEISLLNTIGARQLDMASQLTATANARAARAEAALAQGGPLVPAKAVVGDAPRAPAFQQLATAFYRMQQLEQMVQSIPTTLPAMGMDVSSGFGFRHDPFTGGAAQHAGLDFTGAHGSPIKAAAAGRVSFVGIQNGYGNVVEIDHGHGIMTRYAHLSGFVAHLNQTVHAGDLIARMGSTGRSTGTHLHFEVRINGNAVNPRRFLEANPDVLEVQTRLGQRANPAAGAG